MSISSLGYVGFEVSDTTAWKAFAEDFLGLMPAGGSGDQMRYRLDARAWRIAVEPGEKDDISFAGFEVDTYEAFDALKADLRARGIAFEEADAALRDARGVRDLIRLTDPAGLSIEIYVGATEVTDSPFVSPAGVTSFLTGDQGVGHIVLAASNVDEVRAFYADVLGFRLSDTIGMQLGPDTSVLLEFYHCNPRHHTLALANMPAPKRLHHFMLEMATLDDVGYAMDRIKPCGVQQTMTLGKHSNDKMVSFYVRTPSGFEVEVGCEGIPVHDDVWRVTHHEVTSMWGHKHVG